MKNKKIEFHLIAEGSTVCSSVENKSAKLPRSGARDRCERPDTGSRNRTLVLSRVSGELNVESSFQSHA